MAGMLLRTWAKREKEANSVLSGSSKLKSGLAASWKNSNLKKREGLSRRSEKHQQEAQVLSKGPPGRATQGDCVGLSSVGETLSVSPDRRLACEVEVACINS